MTVVFLLLQAILRVNRIYLRQIFAYAGFVTESERERERKEKIRSSENTETVV
jgi:hypothetical protein